MEKGKKYSFNAIENFAITHNFNIMEFGSNRIGENYIVLSHQEKDIIISFILISASCNQYFYECVYSD